MGQASVAGSAQATFRGLSHQSEALPTNTGCIRLQMALCSLMSVWTR